MIALEKKKMTNTKGKRKGEQESRFIGRRRRLKRKINTRKFKGNLESFCYVRREMVEKFGKQWKTV